MPLSRAFRSASALALILSALACSPAQAETSGAQSMARGDYARAVKELTASAKAGEPQAQLDLGLLLLEGKGTSADAVQAYKWIRQAAEKGLPEAAYQLGQMKEEGQVSEKNLAEAAEWYRKAAEAGIVGAMASLGELYHNGDGFPKDDSQAAIWFRKAAEQNDVESQLALGKLYKYGLGVVRNLNEAGIWFRKAAQLGSPDGRYEVAMLLLDGQEASGKNAHAPSPATVEAIHWLEAAADQNFPPALYALGMAHLGGITAPLDMGVWLALLQQSADQSYPPALRQLGQMYGYGKGVAKDAARGYMYLDLAAQEGDKNAAFERDILGNKIDPLQVQQAKKRSREWLDLRGQ